MARRMFTIARPTVVLPQPDSPTRPMVSPRPRESDTPSTARTSAFFRGMIPPKTGKRTCRSCTSRMTSSEVAMTLVVKVAAYPVARGRFGQRRLDVVAGLEALGATSRELASGRQPMNVGHRSGNGGEPPRRLAVDARQRRKQTARVRMQRIVEQLPDRCDFLNPSTVHN